MNRERFRASLIAEENCKLERHEVQGIDHIGYGINLETELPDEVLEHLGVEDESEIQVITQDQAEWLLDYFINVAIDDCLTVYGDSWNNLSPIRQEVLANLSYNLGIVRLKGFRKMNNAVREGNWAEVSVQMLDSKAAKFQAPKRYSRLAKTFETEDESFLGLPTQYDIVEANETPTTDSPLAGFTNQELLDELARRLRL